MFYVLVSFLHLLTRLLCHLDQHAFWLIYKKMKAEERYGVGGFRRPSLFTFTLLKDRAYSPLLDTGNGHFKPLDIPTHSPANYGATRT